MKCLERDELRVAADAKHAPTVGAMQPSDALRRRWGAGPVVVFKRAGISQARSILIRLPKQIARRTPNISDFAGSSVTDAREAN